MSQPDPTQWSCPAAPGKRGDDNTTHHLVNQYPGILICAYCGKKRSDLIAETEIGHCLVCDADNVRVRWLPGARATKQCVSARRCYERWSAKIARGRVS